MRRRLHKGGSSPFSPYQQVMPDGGGWGGRRQRRKSIWGRAAIFGSSSKSRLSGSWGWSAISALAHIRAHQEGTPIEPEQLLGKGAMKRLPRTPSLLSLSPLYLLTQLPSYGYQTCLAFGSTPAIFLPPHPQGPPRNVGFQLPPHALPLPHKPHVQMTKEPHGMALPLMKKNEKDGSVEAGRKNREGWPGCLSYKE